MTTTANGEYIFGAVHVNDTVTSTVSAGSGYTLREQNTGGADTPPGASEDQIQTTAGTIAATFTQSVARPTTTAIVTLFAVAGAPPSASAPTLMLMGIGT